MPVCTTQNDPCLKQNKTQQTVKDRAPGVSLGRCVLEYSSSHLFCPQARKQDTPANIPVPGSVVKAPGPMH